MANIVLTRIDNRLVHGQVGVTWVSSLDVDTIVVVDDATYFDRISQKIMESIARTSDVSIRFYRVEDFAKRFFEVESEQQLFIIIKTPKTARLLFDKGIPITKINLGNMHFERGKVAITKKVYIDEADVEDLEYLLEHNVEIYYQDVPGTQREKITSLKVK